jgi:hypothetical protein
MENLKKIYLAAAFAVSVTACQTAVTPVGNLQQTTPAAEKKDDSADKLETVKQQDFIFVYVFRRRDGAALDAEDRKFLRANSPPETNQWVVTDDGRAAIAGSNYQFSPANLESLKARFSLEDLSKPKDVVTQSNSNTND